MKGKMKNFAMKAIAGVMAVSMFAMAGCGEALTGDGIGRDPGKSPRLPGGRGFPHGGVVFAP